MDQKEEYHDPDYPEAPVCVKEEAPSSSEEEKVERIKAIIRREFLKELEIRENEVMLIDQRLSTSRRLLHRLRYALVTSYYKDQKLQLTNGQIQDEIAAQHEPRARADVSSILREGQRRLHPSVRKLLGKQNVDIDEIFKTRSPRNKSRKDYSAMVHKRNYTILADTTKTLRPEKKADEAVLEVNEEPCGSRPKKVPRHLEPKITNVVTLDEVTRNKMKHRYRIVIGNTSKYAPPASRMDRSTHKWLLYIRGPASAPDLSRLVTAVSVRLHHSYAPHHQVHIDKPPYHISRRGWGEFPAKIELHFALPERNRPATVEHTIKLDRNYTGMQILGAETLIDVWLYSTPEMLEYEFREDQNVKLAEPVSEQKEIEPVPTTETTEPSDSHTDNWMEFFSKPTEVDVDEMIIRPIKKEPIEATQESDVLEVNNHTEEKINGECSTENIKIEKDWDTDCKADTDLPNEILSQPASPKKRIVKYIDPTTGKIYYLEMDRALDLSKVQEIVINNTKTAKISPIKSNGLKTFRKKKGVSLLKPEVKNMLKNTETVAKVQPNFAHIENDHCYLATPRRFENVASVEIKKEKTLFDVLCTNVARLNNVRCGVNYLIKKIPIITDQARDSDFVKHFPFVVETEERYWKLDFAKRRNIEWSRAKLINRILTEHSAATEPIWRTKQILSYSRLHGYHPIRSEAMRIKTDPDEWSSWNDQSLRKMESSIKDLYPNPDYINTMSVFDEESFTERRNSDSVCEVPVSDDEDVDILTLGSRTRVKTEVCGDSSGLTVLPVEDEDDRLRFLYIERKCADIGIELRNEDVGNGYSYSAVHLVLLSAVRSLAEELVRSALAVKLSEDHAHNTPTVWAGSSSTVSTVLARHVFVCATQNSRTRALTAADTGVGKRNTQGKL